VAHNISASATSGASARAGDEKSVQRLSWLAILLPMRLNHPVLILLSVGACAAPQVPTPIPTDAAPEPPLVRAALAEWEAWGRIVVVGWPETRPADTAATPERFARLVDYWTAVPGGAGVARVLLDQRSSIAAALAEQGNTGVPDGDGPVTVESVTTPPLEDISLYAYPAWSAAFISAMARRAGVPESDLPSSSRHTGYIDAMLVRAITDPQGARFRPYAPEEWAPRPGDLLCADRSAEPLAHWSMRLTEVGRPRPMHCDVVVSNGPGVVEAVGGNVQELVVLRRFPSDSTGRVLPAPSGQPPFVLGLANQEQD
jgi:Uncharacterized protein conserved in bacteria (DUF2272)